MSHARTTSRVMRVDELTTECGCCLQDFMSLDRAIPEDQVGLYGDLAQFPIAGQALVLAYSISTLNSTDPPLVQPHIHKL